MKNQYSHELLEMWDTEKVENTTVFLGGLGATGSQTAVTLARIGIGKIIVSDFDILENRNIGNQMYKKYHMGFSKPDAITEIIQSIGNTKVTAIREKVQNINFDEIDADIFLGNFDNHGARYFLNYISYLKKKPYIDVGIEYLTGSLRFVLPDVTPCMECWPNLLKNPKRQVGCSEQKIPTPFYVASVVSGLQINEMLNYLFGREIHTMIYFDLQKGISNPIKLTRNKECELCGTKALTGV